MATEVSGATSPAYAGGKESNSMLHENTLIRETLSFLSLAPVGPDQGTVPRAAAVTHEGSVRALAGR